MTSPEVPGEKAEDPSKATLEGQTSLQTTDAGETQTGLTANTSLGESTVSQEADVGTTPGTTPSTTMQPLLVPPPPPGPPPKNRGFHERYPNGLVIDAFPRTISAKDVFEAFDGALFFGGPLLDSDESATSLILTLQEWGLGGPDEAPRRQRSRRYDEAAKRGLSSLIKPPGNLEDNQKFICVFQIGLEDDEEFCLVKRILGKAGNNMRRIADDCNAKVRLRGIGSGFLEGSDGTEANMPLQLNVSCGDYTDYVAAVDQVSRLLKDLYKHYRRYARSKQMEPPDVKLSVEEVRRDDLDLDQFAAKANRTAEERERDRKEKEQERRQRAMMMQPPKYQSFERLDKGGSSSDSEDFSGAGTGAEGGSYIGYRFNTYSGAVDDEWRSRTLPSGAPMPTTPAGRRAAARSGGAAAAAAVSAAAREQEREEREKQRIEKEKRRREAEEKAAAAAKKPSRNAPRGTGLVTRSAGDAQQLLPDGQLPIGANTAPQPAVPKGTGKGKGPRKRGGRNRGQGGKGKQAQTADADGDD